MDNWEHREREQASSERPQRSSQRRVRRVRRFIKFLPLTREKLSNLKSVRILNQYKESSGSQQIFTCLFCGYQMLNVVLGLYVLHEYGSYLESLYLDLRDCLLVFSLKWFTSFGLALVLILLILMGSAFTAEPDEIKA